MDETVSRRDRKRFAVKGHGVNSRHVRTLITVTESFTEKNLVARIVGQFPA